MPVPPGWRPLTREGREASLDVIGDDFEFGYYSHIVLEECGDIPRGDAPAAYLADRGFDVPDEVSRPLCVHEVSLESVFLSDNDTTTLRQGEGQVGVEVPHLGITTSLHIVDREGNRFSQTIDERLDAGFEGHADREYFSGTFSGPDAPAVDLEGFPSLWGFPSR